MKNKKAAFEMSITTVVILVIAVIMLILGLVFVRTLICKGIDLVSTSLDAAKRQLQDMYVGGSEVTCAGTTHPLNMVPGGTHVIACSFVQERKVTEAYNYDFKIVSTDIPGQTTSSVQSWVLGGSAGLRGTVNVPSGEPTYVSFAITIPEGTPEGSIAITLDATRSDNTRISTQRMYFKVKSLGAFRQAVC